jgi:hypothetical protein
MKFQYYNKIRWGLAPLAPNDAPPLSDVKITVEVSKTSRKETHGYEDNTQKDQSHLTHLLQAIL